MHKFNCVVTNIRSGIYEYKNGLDRNIIDFVLASASCWILVPPEEIQGNIFIKLENILNFIFRDKDLSFWIFSLIHYNYRKNIFCQLFPLVLKRQKNFMI